ncbi:MAG: TetR/AcrR family transcriptional regulator [Actinomycetota bacterium]
MSSEEVNAPEPSRVERRKATTRARIVDAAEQLMRERGVDGVTIQDITDAADVGHGTFYLHFKTKRDVLRPIITRLSVPNHEQVQRAAAEDADPALRIALGIRFLVRDIAEDPLWSWYARADTSFMRMIADMGSEPFEDASRGMETGRFLITDPQATSHFLDGALIGVVIGLDDGRPVDDVAEATAELVLRVLGVDAREAAEIARVPLAPSTGDVVELPRSPDA